MGGVFGKKTQSTTPTRLNGITINQSVYGNAIPLLYGTSRLPLTLIDYVDFQAKAQSQSSGGKGGGGGSTSSYSYSASIVGLLCEGPNAGVTTVYSDQTQTTLAAQDLVLFTGTSLQAPWTYMTQKHPERALPYDHMAYVAGANYALGSSAGLPNLTFEVKGLLLYNGGPDAEPSQVVVDYCTDPNHGVGFPYLASLTGANSYQAYCIANSFFISPQETTQRAAQSFLAEILQLTNSNCVFTAGVGLRFVPYADQPVTGNGVTYTPNLTPQYSFSDADYIYEEGQAPVQRTITPANETYNVWSVEFLNRSSQYNTDIATFRDEQDIAVNGIRIAPTVSLHEITVASVALQVATLLCFRSIYIRSQFTFKVRADFSLLEPMDYVAINDSIGGIVNQLVRIIEVDDDEDDVFTITAEEMLVGPASAPVYDTEQAQGFAANYGADPGSVNAPYIFTAPVALASAAGNPYEQWIAVNGPSGFWGGAEIYASLDDVTYSRVGFKSNPSRYGTLVNPFAAGPDPDTSNTLTVAFFGSTTIEVDSASRGAADALRSLCIVDGEIISYQTATALGNNTYSFSYIRRGQYGSTIASHAAGTFFAILDDAIFRMSFDPGMVGQPVWFKFVSYNYYGSGLQDLSAVPAYLGSFQGQNGGQLLAVGATPLIARGTVVNVGSRIFKTGGVNAWDSDCYSVDAFASGCFVEFRPMQTTGPFMVGLNADPLADDSYDTIDYAWYCAGDGSAQVYQSGSLIGNIGAYDTNSIFRIQWDGKYVTYFKNGVQYYTTPRPASAGPLYMDSSFWAISAGADNVSFGALNPANPSPFIARNSCKVSDESFSKALGSPNAWESDIYSLEGYPTCHVSFKTNLVTSGSGFMIGLGTNPAQDASYISVNWAWYSASNLWMIYESGNYIQTVSTAASTTDVAVITYDGTNVYYVLNNVLVRTVSAPGLTLFLDSSFCIPGCGANTVQYGPGTALQLSDTAQIGTNAASQINTAFFAGTFPFTIHGITVAGGSSTSNAAVGVSSSITTTGSPVSIDFSGAGMAVLTNSGVTAWSASVTLYRDGSPISSCPTITYSNTSSVWSAGSGNTYPVAFTFSDLTPTAGSHTYEARMSGNATGAGITANLIQISLKIREIKR